MQTEDRLAAGNDALARGAWEDARAAFEAVLAGGESAEALEGLGLAAWWLDDAAATFDARERAYALYAAAADRRSAGRVATWLAWDANAFRGEAAVARGWLARAHRQLEGLEQTSEYGWLLTREGEIALSQGADPVEARRLGAAGAALGRELGDVDLEMVGLALDGLARVNMGEVADGMRLLDEAAAAATGGEMRDLNAIGLACCRLIFACENVRDYDRAGQWADRLSEFCRRWRLRPLFAICRVSYGGVLLSRGSWREAEAELERATAELEATRPGQVGAACARLGELRRRQGRPDEAARLFDRARGHPLAQLGRARLALDGGDAASAVELAETVLRRLPAEYRTERAAALEVVAQALTTAGGDPTAVVGELRAVADTIGTGPLLAAAAYAEGLAASRPEEARPLLDDAVERFERAGLPYEAAQARLALAAALESLGRTALAQDERTVAEKALGRLAVAAGRTQELLSRREREVLRLVSDGLTDGEIAARLVLSEHTVHRHVANIRHKLGAGSRAAAVGAATRLGLLG
jgi:LuxR family maltose regulon positive regulatory protein